MSITSASFNEDGEIYTDNNIEYVNQNRYKDIINTDSNKNIFHFNKNNYKYNKPFKTIYEQMDKRAKYLEKRHQVMTDLFKRNEELYGTRHYDPVKFWKQQCYNTSRFNQNMLINTIWLQALANRIR